ncbi:MAG: hypothetical protein HQM16_04415 [Deltaproteobacteria bacterium]|nr:hypothetical protein [Deltaproteobacteria bacterium]
MIDWIKAHTDKISELSTVVLVVITGVYAWLTYKIAKGGEKTSKSLDDLAKTLKAGQKLQDEMNYLKFREILGSKSTDKRGLDKEFPEYAKRRLEKIEG